MALTKVSLVANTLNTDTLSSKTTNGDLTITGNGTGVVDLALGAKLAGVALTTTFQSASANIPDVAPSANGNVLLVANNQWTSSPDVGTEIVLKDYSETVNIIGSIGGGTQDIDITLGNVVTGTVDTSTTTFTFSNASASGTACSFTLFLTNGGSQTVNWPASVDWTAATAPTLTASGVDVLTFVTVNGGTTWYGFAAGIGMA